MREAQSGEVFLNGTDPKALNTCLSFMYGRLESIPQETLLPLFTVADTYQVRQASALC